MKRDLAFFVGGIVLGITFMVVSLAASTIEIPVGKFTYACFRID